MSVNDLLYLIGDYIRLLKKVRDLEASGVSSSEDSANILDFRSQVPQGSVIQDSTGEPLTANVKEALKLLRQRVVPKDIISEE